MVGAVRLFRREAVRVVALEAEAAAFRDVSDVALYDLMMVFRIDITDELDLHLLARGGFER